MELWLNILCACLYSYSWRLYYRKPVSAAAFSCCGHCSSCSLSGIYSILLSIIVHIQRLINSCKMSVMKYLLHVYGTLQSQVKQNIYFSTLFSEPIVLKQQYKLAKHQSTSIYLKIRLEVRQQRSNIIIVVLEMFFLLLHRLTVTSCIPSKLAGVSYELSNNRIQPVNYETGIIITSKDGGSWKRRKSSRSSNVDRMHPLSDSRWKTPHTYSFEYIEFPLTSKMSNVGSTHYVCKP